ncbi:MAG: signal recognition particle protein [Oscillospiraceae bacterium]|jgi:signal recognition particle subunit SRP54|nr:signal recognition particle protein [Oscillospiraceae bacterium]
MAFEGLSEKLQETFKRLRNHGRVKESDLKEVMREVRLALLEADVNFKVARDFIASVTEKALGARVTESLTPAQEIIRLIREGLTELMGPEVAGIKLENQPPTIIMLCGLQGSGKTTHAAKLAGYYRRQKRRPLLVACDIYRPAAIDQLRVVGSRVNVPVFEMGKENPVTIAAKAVLHARDYGHDIVILDTAGRLHIDEELMEELENIKAKVTPHEILLVVDAMTGQDAVNVAKSFDEILGISGVIMTKLDGDTRGGAALSVRAVTGKPIKFAGTGEKLDALEPFYPDRMASRILGMGDVLTLIDKAQENIDQKEAEKLAKKLEKNKFDLEDLVDQMRQMRKMGSLESILSMLPGVGGKISSEEALEGERSLRQMEAIIGSMTKAERRRPDIINPGRKRRVAAGSGTRVEDVNRLLKQFRDMQKMMKMMQRPGKKRRPGIPGLPF